VRLSFFYQQMKSEKTNKLAIGVEKRSSFITKRGIKIRRHGFVETLSGNNVAKFSPNWSSGCQLVAKNVRTTRQHLTFEKKRKTYFLRRLASNEIMKPKCLVSSILIDTREGSAFSNNRILTGNM